jgi:hypothetical protein
VKAIRFLIDHPEASGAFNLAAPQATTNAEFSKILGKVMRRPSFIPMPAFALKLLFGAKAATLLVSTRQIPKKLQELGFNFDYPTAQAAITDVLKKSKSYAVQGEVEGVEAGFARPNTSNPPPTAEVLKK